MPDAHPPDHRIDPTSLDEDQHPTGAWTIGEQLDEETIAKLREFGATA